MTRISWTSQRQTVCSTRRQPRHKLPPWPSIISCCCTGCCAAELLVLSYSWQLTTLQDTWAVKKETAILTLSAHKGLSRILLFYFRGHNGGSRETRATTTSFVDLSQWKGKACSHMRKIKSGVGNEFAHRFLTHLIGPSEEEEEERKRNRIQEWKAERRRRGFHRKHVAISMVTLQGDWWTYVDLAQCIFRSFGGSFAVLLGNLVAHLPIFCKSQSYTIISGCTLSFQRFTNISQHVMKKNKNITWAFLTFREAILLSRSFATQHFPFAKSAAGQLPDWNNLLSFFLACMSFQPRPCQKAQICPDKPCWWRELLCTNLSSDFRSLTLPLTLQRSLALPFWLLIGRIILRWSPVSARLVGDSNFFDFTNLASGPLCCWESIKWSCQCKKDFWMCKLYSPLCWLNEKLKLQTLPSIYYH